jgi:acyl-coenzyme A thioesterase PaaI-like protein
LTLSADGKCFACGNDNPIGLKLQFEFDGDDYVTVLQFGPEHSGWAGIVHGGLLATVLDEVMVRLLWVKGHEAVTARLTVFYRQTVPVGVRLRVRGRIVRVRAGGRMIETAAEALREDGTVVAEGSAVSLRPTARSAERAS